LIFQTKPLPTPRLNPIFNGAANQHSTRQGIAKDDNFRFQRDALWRKTNYHRAS
jgi:hypothetical protein